MAKEIFFSLSPNKAVVDMGSGKYRYQEVELGKVEEITPGYTYRPFKFTDSKLSGCVDGAIYDLAPYIATQPAFIKKKVNCIDRVLTGRGLLLVVRPYQTFYARFIGYTSTNTPEDEEFANLEREVAYDKGSIVTWVAGEGGLTILGITRPVFTPDMEIIIKPGTTKIRGRTIPEDYWNYYNRYTSQHAQRQFE